MQGNANRREFRFGAATAPWHQGLVPTAILTIAAFLLCFPPALAQNATQDASETSGASVDFDSEPDLPGLLAATGDIEMTAIEPGLAIGTAVYPPFGLRIHVFDFAQDRFTLRAVEQKAATGSRAPDFLDGADDVFVVNGGFFERRRGRLSASGLLVIDGNLVSREHDRAGSGVIYSGADGVGITYRKDLGIRSEIDQAIQVGPILVDPGGVKGIYKNVGGRFNRSAVCLRDASFTAVVVEGGISLFQLADLLSLPVAEGGFGCDIAINLDGGPSTQAAFRAGTVLRGIAGGATAHNFLVISRTPGG